MKTIIAGGRNYDLCSDDYAYLEAVHEAYGISEIVCGMARGADTYGRLWGEEMGIPIAIFYPDWDGLGKYAGIERNGRMADYADALILFPGGRGTTDMYNQAHERGLWIFDWREDYKDRSE